MNTQLFLLDAPDHETPFSRLDAHRVHSEPDLRSALCSRGRSVWVAPHGRCLLAQSDAWLSCSPRSASRSLLLLEPVSDTRRVFLRECFKRILEPGGGVHFLPFDELAEVLSAPNRGDLAIATAVDSEDAAAILFRGDLSSLVVPLSWFSNIGSSPKADPNDCEVTDYGQTIRMGEFEASVDAILYEFDADYRKRAKARKLEQDDSLGACIQRLRLMRQRGRGDFEGITGKEMARIERGEVRKPHKDTLERIAKTLGVEVDDLQSY